MCDLSRFQIEIIGSDARRNTICSRHKALNQIRKDAITFNEPTPLL